RAALSADRAARRRPDCFRRAEFEEPRRLKSCRENLAGRHSRNQAMLFVQNLISAVEQLWANKLRSFLTVLGIVIGVMSTVVVVASVQGYSNYIAGFLREMGTNAIWVHPGRPPGFHEVIGRTELTLADIEEIDQSCPAINRTSP